MKVYIHSISYLPRTNSGAVRYNHALAQFLLQSGCQVRVLVDQVPEPYEHDGVEVFNFAHHPKLMRWADVVICEPARFRLCQGHQNVVVIQHTMWPTTWDYTGAKVIYCANHVERKCKYRAKKSMVLYPWSRYHGEKKPKSKEKNLTLVNCNANKGGPVIPALARLLPTERFTCVKGSYGQQFVYPLKNVEYLENEDELLRVYGDTSVLLLPSAAEGFPTVALEAMSLGIPVAAFPIDAMKEMLGDTMPLAKRSSAPHLVATVQELLSDIKVYSKLAMLRYQQVCDIQHEQLQRLPEFIMP